MFIKKVKKIEQQVKILTNTFCCAFLLLEGVCFLGDLGKEGANRVIEAGKIPWQSYTIFS